MTTPTTAFAAVANALSGVDPKDEEAVTSFYRWQFYNYSPQVRALISDFLIGHVGLPTEDALQALKLEITKPAIELPELELPDWDPAYGAEMNHTVPSENDTQQSVHAIAG